MEAAFALMFVAMPWTVNLCSLTSVSISGAQETLNHILVTTLLSFATAVMMWVVSSRSSGEHSPSRARLLIRPDLKELSPDSDLDPQLVAGVI